MKAKKPLLVTVLAAALLAVGLILPAAAMGETDIPVNWVQGNYNSSNDVLPDTHMGFTINVQQGSELTNITGFVLQKIMLTDPEGDFADAPVVRRATEFWPENDIWAGIYYSTGLVPPYLANYARFYDVDAVPVAIPPSNADDFTQADIADFVIYLPVPFGEFLEYGCTTWPHRYVIVDFDDPHAEDLVQIYGWVPGLGWWPQLPASAATFDLVSVPAGSFHIHVGLPCN